MKTDIDFWSYLAQFFLEWEMFQIKLVKKIKKHTLCSIFFPENRTFYEIMWNNIVEPDRPLCAWYLRLQTKHSEYVILLAFSLQKWLQGRALSVTLCRHALRALYNMFRKLSE